MTKSATDVMQDIVVAAVLDGIAALRAASKGVPNALLRDLNALHQNTSFADFPPDLQTAVSTSVREALTRLHREGYAVSPVGAGLPPRGPGGPPRGPAPRPGGARPGGNRPPAGGRGRPERKPGPRT